MDSFNQSKPFAILLALVVVSLILVGIGFALRRRGALRSRPAALGWAVLCVVPLFGAGLAMAIHHAVEDATGRTRSGVNGDPAHPSR